MVPEVERSDDLRANLLGDFVMTLPLSRRCGRRARTGNRGLTDVRAGGVLTDALDLLDLGVGDGNRQATMCV